MAQAYQQFSPLNALAFVQQQGDIGRERGQRNQLNQLAGQAYSATTPEEQRGLLTSMAVIDPAAAQQQQKSFAYDEERRNTTMVNMAKLLTSAPEQARPGLYQQMAPTLAKFGLSDLPQQYDAQTAPIINQAAQSLVQAYSGGAGGNVQSTYVNDQGQRVAIMRDGSTQVLGGNDAGANQQTLTIDVNGTPTQVTFDRRTGRYTNASLGVPAQQIQQINGQPTYIDPSLPPQVQAALRAGAGDNLQDGGQLQMPQAAGQPLQGRRAEDQAAAVEAAKLGVQQQYLPQELQMRTQAALAQEAGKAQVAAQADANKLQMTRSRDANTALDLLNEAEALLPNATGSLSGALYDSGAAAFGTATPGAQATAALKTIAGQLTSKMPRMEGPQSDKDVQLYKEMAGDLANDRLPVATRQAALRQIRGLQQKYAGQQQSAPRQIQSAEEYNALPSGALFIAPDGTQRRKR